MPESAVLRAAPSILALAIFTLLLFGDGIATGQRTFYTPVDGVDAFYAYYQKLARSVHQGYLPIWDADTLGGHSFVGELQPGVFYPPTIVMAWFFGSQDGLAQGPLEVLVALHHFLAALGMYIMARCWGLSNAGSLLASLVFAFSGCVAARAPAQPAIFFGLAWIPMGLALLTVGLRHSHWLAWSGAGAVIALQLLAGHVQPAFHTVLLYGIYAACYIAASPTPWAIGMLRALIGTACAVGTMIVLSFPQLWLSAQYLSNAYRWVGADHAIVPGEKVPFDVYGFEYMVQPQDLLNFLDAYKFQIADNNYLYIGILPLVLVLMFASSSTLRTNVSTCVALRRFLLVSLTVGAFAVLGHYSFASRLLHATPLVGQIRELGRYVVLIHVALAVLSGLSLDAVARLRRDLSRRERTLAFTAAALLGIEAWYLLFMHDSGLSMSTTTGIAAVAVVFALIGCGLRGATLTAACLLAVAVSTQVNRNWLMIPIPLAQQASSVFQRTQIVDYLAPYYGQYRVVFDLSAGLSPNYGLAHPIQTKMGYGATCWRPYFDFIDQDWSLDGRVNDLLNIRWVISKAPLPLPLVMEEQRTGLKLFERANYYPRVFFKSQLDTPGRELASRNYFESLEYTDLYQKYRIRTQAEEDVIFSEVNYPGWGALVNGMPAPIATADIPGMKPLFRQVRLPAGEHIVEFRYLL